MFQIFQKLSFCEKLLRSSIFELQNGNLRQKKTNLNCQFFHHCQKCAILWSHFACLKMHRRHAHRNSLLKWGPHTHWNLLPHIPPPQVVAAHRKSCFGILLSKCSGDWDKFEITRTIYSNNERSEQFLVTECFFHLFLEVFQI